MKKKMILGSIGAILITLLMISSATAVIMPQSNENPNSRNYFDKKIVLTDKKISELEKALTYSQDSEISELIQGIIDLLHEKEKISNKDIREMIKTNDIHVNEYYGLARIKADYSGGDLNWPMLRAHFLPTLIFRGCILWHAFYYDETFKLDVSINGQQINYEHSGFALCYTGFAADSLGPKLQPWFGLSGISLSVFISG